MAQLMAIPAIAAALGSSGLGAAGSALGAVGASGAASALGGASAALGGAASSLGAASGLGAILSAVGLGGTAGAGATGAAASGAGAAAAAAPAAAVPTAGAVQGTIAGAVTPSVAAAGPVSAAEGAAVAQSALNAPVGGASQVLPNGQIINLTKGGVTGFDMAQAVTGKGATTNVGQAAGAQTTAQGAESLSAVQSLLSGGGGELPPPPPAQLNPNAPKIAGAEGAPVVEDETGRDGEALQKLILALLARGNA